MIVKHVYFYLIIRLMRLFLGIKTIFNNIFFIFIGACLFGLMIVNVWNQDVNLTIGTTILSTVLIVICGGFVYSLMEN